MKKGCLLALIVWIVSGLGNAWLLREFSFASAWWIPVALGFGTALIAANFSSLILALKQQRASGAAPSDWKDGQLVAVGGRIQALRSPLEAPFSGKRVVISEYEVRRRTAEGQSNMISLMGFLMTSCSISTARGPVRIIGFPLMTKIKEVPLKGDAIFERAARFLLACTFKVKPKNPLALLKELSGVLADDDGEVQAHFSEAGATGTGMLLKESDPTDDDDFEEEKDSEPNSATDLPPASVSDTIPPPASSDSVLDIARRIAAEYILVERSIDSGAEVVVFGTYRLTKRAIDVGSGITNLSHQIQIGSLSSVTRKNISSALLALVVWGGATLYGYYYVWSEAEILTSLLTR